MGEDFAREWWNSDACRLAFQNVTKGLKFRVSATNRGGLQLESGDVRPHDDFVGCVHATAHSMRHWIAHFDLQEVLRGPVKLLVRL